MTNTTIWWQSKTVWGTALAMLAGVSGLAGIDLNQSVQNELTDILTSAGALVGGAFSLYGRAVAVSQLVWSKP
jgi:hypothetical protein